MMVSSFPSVEYRELFYYQLKIEKTVALKNNSWDFEQTMFLSKLASADISWWMRNALTSKKGIHHRKTSHTCYTHTSTKGCVQTWMTPQLGEWSSSEESHHNYYLELNAILLGFSPRKNNKSLLTIGGAKDLGALRSGDTVRLVPPGNPSKEAVKAKVEGVLELDPLRWLPKMEPDIVEITVTWGKQRRPAGVEDLLWWLKEALSNRINS